MARSKQKAHFQLLVQIMAHFVKLSSVSGKSRLRVTRQHRCPSVLPIFQHYEFPQPLRKQDFRRASLVMMSISRQCNYVPPDVAKCSGQSSLTYKSIVGHHHPGSGPSCVSHTRINEVNVRSHGSFCLGVATE